jgi:hypothetical protein
MNNSPVFWNTQGEIKFDSEKNFFNYETSMSINWRNKSARRVLITIMKLLNRPSILDLRSKGVAIWTNDDLRNAVFYKRPIVFNEIIIRDEYVYDENKVFNPQYPFLSVSYNFKLDNKHIMALSEYYNYINYDSLKHTLTVKSKTLEENILILNIFLDSPELKSVNIPIFIKKKMNKLNKKTTFEFIEQMKMYIRNIAENDLDISPLPSNKDKSIVEESSTDVGSDINNSDVLMDTVDEEFIYE